MKLIRDFVLCCLGGLMLWGIVYYGIGLHMEALERQNVPPIERRR